MTLSAAAQASGTGSARWSASLSRAGIAGPAPGRRRLSTWRSEKAGYAALPAVRFFEAL